MKNIFDSHAHYDDEKFSNNLKETINHIKQNGVVNVINVGCDIKSSLNSISLAKEYPFFYASVGIHPHQASEFKDVSEIEKLLDNPKVVAIGEIGLDYHYDFSPRETQIKVFEEQLKFAVQKNIPVIIHSREATKDTMDLLNKYKPKGVVHCFSGSAQTAKEVISLGMYIGFTGSITFKNNKKASGVINEVPLDKLLLETDCPYMAPEPFRGMVCTSDMIEKTAMFISQVKSCTEQISAQQIVDIANQNTHKLFNIY
ncbi:MAG: TatD family hydrolase [Oscillospiraceae bacterium]